MAWASTSRQSTRIPGSASSACTNAPACLAPTSRSDRRLAARRSSFACRRPARIPDSRSHVKTSGSDPADFARTRSRPTVVVADDHRRMLDAVSNLLADDFRLVAAVTDGRQAVDAVNRLEPDVVVLDITMP